MRPSAAAPALDLEVPPQPRRARGESPDVYAAILVLRRQGFIVMREGRGRHHVYRLAWGLRDKRALDDRLLIASAALMS